MLHDLNLAEAKGTGIRSMRRPAAEAGLTLPEFHSSRESNEFRVTHFLHSLRTEDDHAWLRSLTIEALDAEEVKVLIYTRATGAADNTACRHFSGLDTLAACRVLRRLRDKGLLEKRGAGSQTHCVLARPASAPFPTQPTAGVASGIGDAIPPCSPAPARGDSPHPPHALASIPPELQARICAAGAKPRKAEVRELVLALCALRPFTVNELCQALGGGDTKELRRTYLRPWREEGLLSLKYPETEKHPHQAYVAAGTRTRHDRETSAHIRPTGQR